MTKMLQHFYEEILDWIEAGEPKHPVFSSHLALCITFRRWHCEYRSDLESDPEYLASLREMSHSFKSIAGGDPAFPFGRHIFARESKLGTHYKNENRLAFIRSQVEVDNG